LIIETTYTAENRDEKKVLQLMHQVMQGTAGVNVEFLDGASPEETTLTVKESRRKRIGPVKAAAKAGGES
jgi:hypothetical protein